VDPFWIKTAFVPVVFAVGLGSALLPWVLGSRGSSDRALALGDTFAGGVIGGAGLVHLLGGGIDGFRAAAPGVHYPLALLLAGVGFLLILLIEGVVVPGRSPGDGHGGGRPTGSHHEIGWPPVTTGRQVPYAVILLVVLSVHSVVLGLALGAQRTVSGALLVFLAIVAHKGMAGFALGVGYQRAGYTVGRAVSPVVFFSAMTPLGILVGTAVGASLAAHAQALFEATFDSLGAGTFVYIAALDIIKTEFDDPDYRGQKWLAATLGFGIMAFLALWL